MDDNKRKSIKDLPKEEQDDLVESFFALLGYSKHVNEKMKKHREKINGQKKEDRD